MYRPVKQPSVTNKNKSKNVHYNVLQKKSSVYTVSSYGSEIPCTKITK